MIRDEVRKRHSDVLLAGLRDRTTAIGLVQLVVELRRAGVLDDAAVGRIRDAVLDEMTVSRNRGKSDESFLANAGARLEALLKVEE